MPTKTEPVFLIARESFVGQLKDGSDFIGKRNVTRVRSDSEPARRWPHLFKPMESSYFDVEAATAAPGEMRSA